MEALGNVYSVFSMNKPPSLFAFKNYAIRPV